SNTALATVTSGVATSKAQGAPTITSTFHGVNGTATLTVTAPVLRGLSVTPTTVNVAKGATAKLTATGTYSDGSTQDVSNSANWLSDTPSVATVDTHGLVTAVATSGTAGVSAGLGGFLSSSTVTATPAAISSVAITPATRSVPLGDPATYTAAATWTDGSVTDVTSSATWSSSNTGVATVSAGTASTHATGTSTITAT